MRLADSGPGGRQHALDVARDQVDFDDVMIAARPIELLKFAKRALGLPYMWQHSAFQHDFGSLMATIHQMPAEIQKAFVQHHFSPQGSYGESYAPPAVQSFLQQNYPPQAASLAGGPAQQLLQHVMSMPAAQQQQMGAQAALTDAMAEIFDDLEAYKDYCRFNGLKYNERDLYRSDQYRRFDRDRRRAEKQ